MGTQQHSDNFVSCEICSTLYREGARHCATCGHKRFVPVFLNWRHAKRAWESNKIRLFDKIKVVDKSEWVAIPLKSITLDDVVPLQYFA